MCGICGKINTQGKVVPEDLIRRMTDSLRVRGPDDAGIYQTNTPLSVSLGHRRLSIIDLSSFGKQPMTNEDKTIWLVFNGEIYNHQSLRQELQALGHQFTSQTDTEVIIHLYEQEGIRCLEKLNGMFAFGLWDAKSQALYLCRDRAGIKPLVYSWDGESLIFASEIRSLLCDPQINRELDHDALDLYLTLNYIPAPYTIYQGIRKLEPASYLLLKNNTVTRTQYWGLNNTNTPVPENFEECKKHLYDLLEDSVKRQCVADVPLGAFLSGGIDSSIIVGLMAKTASSRVRTFSIGYEDMPLLDETHFARQVAKLHQTDHTEIRLRGRDMIPVFHDLLSWFDEPFADSSAIPTFIVSRETKKHVKVALSGDGGDELFAGYRMYAGEYWYSQFKQLPLFLRKMFIEPWVNQLPDSRNTKSLEQIRRLKKFIQGAAADTFEERFFLWNQINPQILRQNLLKRPVSNFNLGQDIFKRSLNQYPMDPINKMLWADFKNSLPNDMLTKVDWMS
ncbi:MAG: asparagine synthase (glutamine-hydrolyzing), partial [Candidatus Omnitrophica bacterium]|nr:asparagine synthase (glutamine-hydrolyzing) [Candidatus Omnitrophota bacterium]